MFKIVYWRKRRICEDDTSSTLEEAFNEIKEREGNGQILAIKIINTETKEEFDRDYIDEHKEDYPYFL